MANLLPDAETKGSAVSRAFPSAARTIRPARDAPEAWTPPVPNSGSPIGVSFIFAIMTAPSLVPAASAALGMNLRRHPASMSFGETLGSGTAFAFLIPAERFRQHQSSRGSRPKRMDIGNERHQRLPALRDAGFRCLLDGVDHVPPPFASPVTPTPEDCA